MTCLARTIGRVRERGARRTSLTKRQLSGRVIGTAKIRCGAGRPPLLKLVWLFLECKYALYHEGLLQNKFDHCNPLHFKWTFRWRIKLGKMALFPNAFPSPNQEFSLKYKMWNTFPYSCYLTKAELRLVLQNIV